MFLILVAPTARARIIHSLQNTLEVGINSERRFQLFHHVAELDGGVRRKHGVLTAVHVALALVVLQQTLPREAVQAESAEMMSICTLRDLVG